MLVWSLCLLAGELEELGRQIRSVEGVQLLGSLPLLRCGRIGVGLIHRCIRLPLIVLRRKLSYLSFNFVCTLSILTQLPAVNP